jgi:flagellar M-ring protein FliF
MRPLAAALISPSQLGALLPSQLTHAPATAAAGAAQAIGAPASGAIAAPHSGIQAMIDIAQVEGQVKESSVRKVGEIVTKHPDEATSILRQWLHGEA